MNMERFRPDFSRKARGRLPRRTFLGHSCRGLAAAIAGVGCTSALLEPLRRLGAAEHEVLPKHVTPETLRAVIKGMDYLAAQQSDDGSWIVGGGEAYPVAMTGLAGTALLAHGDSPTRGKYSKNVQGAVEFLVRCATPNGLLTGPTQDSGLPMHGHGFALMFLACVYGMISKEGLRQQVGAAIRKAVALTSQGQSGQGGWTYIPGAGDEGSVTVTQVQALRAAHNAGFLVPRGVIEEAVRYLEKCRTPEGGIRYSLSSGGGSRLPISAAAVATLYNAGQFDNAIATDCLKYVWDQYRSSDEWNKGGGHAFYTHLYAAQGFYMAGDQYWDGYFPKAREQLIAMQAPDGSWNGDGIGQVYGTAVAVIILQLPFKYLPIFQR
jgi:Prenyltransferase and squalene oxidase repeat